MTVPAGTPEHPTEQPYLARRQNWTNQLARHALMQPDGTALRYLGVTTTWIELARRVTALAGALHQRGVGFGDRFILRGCCDGNPRQRHREQQGARGP